MRKILQDVAEVHYGKSQNGVADKYGCFPIIGTGGFLGYARKPLFSGPAIVVGRKGTLDNPIYAPDDFWAVDTTYAVIPKENIHPKWLYFTLKNARLELLNEATGVPSLSRDRLFRVPVQNIELPEQSRIAYVLGIIDEAIAQTEAVIAKVKQVLAGMLHDLLSYGLDEHGQFRDPVAHPEQFKDSPLGLIPKEWDIKPLSSVCQKIADRDHTTPVYVDDGVRMVSPIHFRGDDEIDFEACPRITKDAHRKNCLKTDIRAGDLILHRIGAGLGQIRRVTPDMPEFSILHSLAQVRTAPERITADFLYWVMQSNAVKTQISLGIQSIGVPDLGLDKIGNLLVLVPHDSDEQTKIAQRLSLVADFLKREIYALNKAKHLKFGLQDDLLTGRVRVPETIMEGAVRA